MKTGMVAVLAVIGIGVGAARAFSWQRGKSMWRRCWRKRSSAPAQSSEKLNSAPVPIEGAAEDAAYLAFDQGKYLTALSLAEARAAQGDAQAHALVGRIYAEGLGVAKDEVTAARWLAARLNSAMSAPWWPSAICSLKGAASARIDSGRRSCSRRPP